MTRVLLLIAIVGALFLAMPAGHAQAYTLSCSKARYVITHSPVHVPGKWWRELHCHRISAHVVRIGFVRVHRFHGGHWYDISWPGCRCRRA
jgi:hypothetical protein